MKANTIAIAITLWQAPLPFPTLLCVHYNEAPSTSIAYV